MWRAFIDPTAHETEMRVSATDQQWLVASQLSQRGGGYTRVDQNISVCRDQVLVYSNIVYQESF